MEALPKHIKITFDDTTKQINIEISNVNSFEFALAIMNMQAMLMKTLMDTMNVGTQDSKIKGDTSYR